MDFRLLDAWATSCPPYDLDNRLQHPGLEADMTIAPGLREYHQFYADLLASKWKGSNTEDQMIERLIGLCERRNMYALRARDHAKLTYAPNAFKANSVYANGAIYRMENIATPTQTGPAGTDSHGLWREDGGRS